MVVAALVAALVTAGTAVPTGSVPTGTAAAEALGPPPLGPLTESTTAVVGPDGSPGLTLYTGPVHMRRDTGWVPVDLTLVTGPDGSTRPVASPHELVLTPTGPQVRFAGGSGTALDWPTPLPAPVLDGPRATYRQAAAGYDLVVEATGAGFMASLRRAGAPATAAVPPLALRNRTEGTRDTAVDYVVAAAPVTGPAPVPFDTTVQTNIQFSDPSGQPDLRLGSYDGQAVARSFLTFDTAGLGRRPVARATLSMFQSWSSSCQARTWEVWSAAAPGPATRWGNQPALDRLQAASTDTRGNDPACAAGWSTVDITDLVRSWSQAGVPAGTVGLRATDETDPLGWKRFGSAESSTVPHVDVVFG